MWKDTPKALLQAVMEINKKTRAAYVEEQQALQEKMAAKQMKMPKQPEPKADPAAHAGAKSMAEAKSHTVPKTAKEKSLAAIAEPKDKITHADVMKGRGVKEGWDEMEKSVKDWREKRKEKDDMEVGSSRTTKTGHTVTKTATGKKVTRNYNRKTGETEHKYVKEGQDTPGNSAHQCAIHVKSEQFGEGRTLTSQHAEPDADGNIAWYDVMFDEGIKRVDTTELEILVSESHMNHKKKKM